MSERELKPCPHCGSEEVEIDLTRAFAPLGRQRSSLDTETTIYCLKCPAGMSFCHGDWDGKLDDLTVWLVDQWNTRAALSPIPDPAGGMPVEVK